MAAALDHCDVISKSLVDRLRFENKRRQLLGSLAYVPLDYTSLAFIAAKCSVNLRNFTVATLMLT